MVIEDLGACIFVLVFKYLESFEALSFKDVKETLR